MEELTTCKLCSAASHLRFQVKEYIQHIKLFHAHQVDFKIICGNHVYAVHGEEDCEDISVNNVSMDCDEDNNNRDDDDDNYSDDDDVFMDQPASQISAIHDSQPSSSKEIVQKSSAILLLGLKNLNSQISLQGVIQGVIALTQQNISMLKSQVCTYLYFKVPKSQRSECMSFKYIRGIW